MKQKWPLVFFLLIFVVAPAFADGPWDDDPDLALPGPDFDDGFSFPSRSRQPNNGRVLVPAGRNGVVVDPNGNTGIVVPPGSEVRRFGRDTIIRDPDGRETTLKPFGRDTIVSGPDGQETTVSPFGRQTIIRDDDGRETTVTPFGNQTIIDGPDGETVIRPFGHQTIVEGPNGQTTTLDRDDFWGDSWNR